MINDSDIKKQRETDVSFVKFHWDFASENMTLCVTRGVVVIALMSPAPAVHVDASDPGFMDFTYPAVLRKSKSIPWIRLSRVFVESLWVLFICLCFVHVCPFGHTDIGHVTCRIYGAYYGALWKSKFSYWSLSWWQMFDACGILEICWKLNRSICHICPLPTWLFWSGQAQKKRKMFDSGHRFRGQGTGLPGSATCIDTDRTFFQALGSGLGVGEKRGGRGTKRGRLGKGNRGITHWLTACCSLLMLEITLCKTPFLSPVFTVSLFLVLLTFYGVFFGLVLRGSWLGVVEGGGSAGWVGFGQLCLGEHRSVALVNLKYDECGVRKIDPSDISRHHYTSRQWIYARVPSLGLRTYVACYVCLRAVDI